MSGIIKYTPIGDGQFTTEILDQNFAAYSEALNSLANSVAVLNETTNAINNDLLGLAKVVSSMQKAKGSVTPFLLGAGIGIYIYRNRLKVKAMMDYASQQAAEQRKEEPIKTEAQRADKPTA